MFTLSIPWWEFVIRAIVVYFFLLLLLRITGKRQVGQLAPFDFVLLLVLSNAVQNAMNAGDNSLLAGIILSLTLVTLNFVLGVLVVRNKSIAGLVEGRPQVIIHNGVCFEDVLRREKLNHHEINAALRSAGCLSISEVHYAILENNGEISVKKKDNNFEKV